MSNSIQGSSRDESPFTVEDTGSTTDAADLVGGERARQGDAALADDAAPSAGHGTAHAVSSTGEAMGAAGDGGALRTGERGVDPDLRDEGIRTEPMDEVDRGEDGLDDRTGRGNGLASLIDDEGPADHAERAPQVDDDAISHVFDQTNGVIERAEGESDGTAAGDEASIGDRSGVRPVGQQDAFAEDHPGTDGRGAATR